MFKFIRKKIRTAIIGFSYGLKNTESDVFGQKSSQTSPDNSIQQRQQLNQLGEALLKGEITEEVEILRDRTYLVSEEAKKYRVIINDTGEVSTIKNNILNRNEPTVFKKNTDQITKIVMDNTPISTGVLTGLQSVGGYGIKDQHQIEFEYEYVPKFKLENYVKRIVLTINTKTNASIVDLYIPKYSGSFERMEKLFDNEIDKIKQNKIKPTNIQFKELNFITNKCYGFDDLYEIKITPKKFLEINDFDGKYVLSYEVEAVCSVEKITEKYRNEKLRSSYNKKEKRKNTTLNLSNEQEITYCEKCGKKLESVYDFRITKATIGVGICNSCLNDMT